MGFLYAKIGLIVRKGDFFMQCLCFFAGSTGGKAPPSEIRNPLLASVCWFKGIIFNRKRDDAKLKRKMFAQIPSPFANLIPFGRYCVS